MDAFHQAQFFETDQQLVDVFDELSVCHRALQGRDEFGGGERRPRLEQDVLQQQGRPVIQQMGFARGVVIDDLLVVPLPPGPGELVLRG